MPPKKPTGRTGRPKKRQRNISGLRNQPKKIADDPASASLQSEDADDDSDGSISLKHRRSKAPSPDGDGIAEVLHDDEDDIEEVLHDDEDDIEEDPDADFEMEEEILCEEDEEFEKERANEFVTLLANNKFTSRLVEMSRHLKPGDDDAEWLPDYLRRKKEKAAANKKRSTLR